MDAVEDIQREAERLKSAGLHKDSESKYDQVITILQQTLDSSLNDVDRPKIRKRQAEMYNERGQVQYLQVAFTEAVEDFTTAISLCPDMAVAYYNRGLIHYRLARFDMAIKDMEKCLSIHPTFESAKDCRKQSIIDKQEHMKRFPELY